MNQHLSLLAYETPHALLTRIIRYIYMHAQQHHQINFEE